VLKLITRMILKERSLSSRIRTRPLPADAVLRFPRDVYMLPGKAQVLRFFYLS
jgi:hypothetical protein